MKKKILITLSIYSIVFILGGIYIISTIASSTTKLQDLISLYQIETQRKQLLIRIKNVQADLHLKRTPYSKSVSTFISNVNSMEDMTNSCFECHHSEEVVTMLTSLKDDIESYKQLISRVMTIRANEARLRIEDDKAYRAAENLLADVNGMVHLATVKLSEKTKFSLSDISNSNTVLFLLISITPFFAVGLGFIFVKGITKPIKEILMATRNLKSGNLDFRLKGLEDEFGEVAESFNEMADRVEDYTQKLEGKTSELESAHDEMSTFCQVLKQVGIQQKLGGVGSFLINKFQQILNTRYMKLFAFSSDLNSLFILSDKGVEILEEKELIENISNSLKEMNSINTSPGISFPSPLIQDDVPLDGQQTIIPFRIENYTQGALVIVCSQDCLCDENKLKLIALILEQASGSIKRAILHQEEICFLQKRIESMSEFSGIIGKDPKMQTIYKLIEDIAHTDATILIQGDTGTGKELVARAIYKESLRNDKPFVVINCAAYPSTLLESELFGHEKGAFTGAIRKKMGRFEQADGGTVFLDEIGEIPLPSQIKLLRVLQTQKFERLGGEQTLAVNVRIIAATNKDLIQEVKRGNFREDLYYRLNVIPIHLPLLRNRRNDIPLLARHFQRRFAAEHGDDVKDFSSEAMRRLLDYPWPGNVRELENTIEHAVVLSKGQRTEVAHLPSILINNDTLSLPAERNRAGTMVDHEKKLLIDVLKECSWNKSKAALQLGISRSTLYGKLKKYQVSEDVAKVQ
ncbi:MAG: sigma 54-interacting transcriptional regulator [Desulfobacteraceae bacterium]|nr:sigma 54-interacting transcriptional regulator [Desulfobacteraceae bacterium]MDH3720647.1 sigma 54-interacting transcriptional regulator [Desulfobacteraceae bacterium]MDH3836508.1 sigma 54-interacting transcriptional regulator [Desulfobacteraceae bacterium]MDH3875656.1 sigma 54-interacting transcriptional regulator [Desulfobacteraceae bacterium]MDH3955751.1 sigma 54-interacting transcriptional regulator [Desulfobacteraceae bacterium]